MTPIHTFKTLAGALRARKPHESIFARDLDEGKKLFFTCTTEYLVKQSNASKWVRPLLNYEVLSHSCKFFLDIDGVDLDPILHWLSKSPFGGTFRIYHAPPKQSYHIRGTRDSHVYADVRELRDAILRANPPPGVDLSVYTKNRLMRCVGSTKWGESRPLVPWGAPFCGIQLADFINVPTENDPDWGFRSSASGGARTEIPSSFLQPHGEPHGEPHEYLRRHYDVYEGRSTPTCIYVNSKCCAIAGREHKSNKIYFTVEGSNLIQRCFKCTGAVKVEM